ncbi:MAG: ABC transporter substrate-binding protein [Deltaproteobacteria bacterium]|nr:ABC transporter substrate-binding protein [Deltaproteobacteria bacterium]
MSKKRSVAFALAVIFSLIVTPFGASHAQKLLVPYPALGGTSLALWITHDAGLFRKYGLDVDLVFMGGGGRTVRVLLAGQSRIASVDPTALVQAAAGGVDVVMVSAMTGTLPYLLVTRPEIQTKEDLKGKKIAVSGFGGASDFVTRLVLEGLGLSPDRDVVIMQVGDVPTRLMALESKTVHATVLVPPAHLLAKRKGLSVLVDIAGLGIKIPNSTIGTTRAHLSSHRDVVRKFLMAFLEGIKVLKSDAAFSINVLSKYSRTTDRDSLSAAYEIYAKIHPERPYVDPPSINKIIDFFSKRRPEIANLKPDEMIDMSLLREIDQSGFIDSLYKK